MFSKLKDAHQKSIDAVKAVKAAEVKLNEADIEFDNQLLALNEQVDKIITADSGLIVEFTTMVPHRYISVMHLVDSNNLFFIVRRVNEQFVETHPCVESYQPILLIDNEKDVIKKALEFLQANGLKCQDNFYSNGNLNIYLLSTGK